MQKFNPRLIAHFSMKGKKKLTLEDNVCKVRAGKQLFSNTQKH